jgi:hypothetical protein
VLCIYLGHRDIRVSALPAGHLARLQAELCVMCSAMGEVLVAPTVSHGRHLLTSAGRHKHVAVSAIKRRLHARIMLAFGAISAAARDTVAYSAAPGADASRLAQYHRDLMAAWERLRCVKSYRTPQTTRAYAHVAVWAHPFIMGPYYAWVAGAGGAHPDGAAGLGFAIFLAVATAVSLSALVNARYALEDPFVPGLLDTIRVGKELGLVQQNLAAWAAADSAGSADAAAACSAGENGDELRVAVHSGGSPPGEQ